MTHGTIMSLEKKFKASNQDCRGFEVDLEHIHPDLENAVQKWIHNFGIDFNCILIIQNGTYNRKYMLGEEDNLV
jgi:hypothetical protein